MKDRSAAAWLARLPRPLVRWWSRRLDARLCGDRGYWLFVLGVNNSGTTLLARLLESHPEVRTMGWEGQHLTHAFPHPARVGAERLWSRRMDLFRWRADDDPRPAVRAKLDWSGHYSREGRILLEKSPPNTLRALWLQENFSPSRFVVVVRNPLAVCEGIRRRTGCSIEEAARHWRRASTCLLEDLEHLRSVLVLKYETLVGEPASVLGRLEDFLELEQPFDGSVTNEVGAHSMDGTTRGLTDFNARSLARLSAADRRVIEEECGEVAARLGYRLD